MRKIHLMVPLLLLSLVCCGANAFADLIGSTVTSQYYAYGGPYNGNGSPATFVADGTVQQTFCATFCPEGFYLTVAGNQITYELFGEGFWSPSVTSYNSGGLFIANGNLLTFAGVNILGVTLDPATTLNGFTAANVTFNASNIAIDWADFTGIQPGDKVVLDVATPEPGSLLLLLTGVAGLVTRMRHK